MSNSGRHRHHETAEVIVLDSDDESPSLRQAQVSSNRHSLCQHAQHHKSGSPNLVIPVSEVNCLHFSGWPFLPTSIKFESSWYVLDPDTTSLHLPVCAMSHGVLYSVCLRTGLKRAREGHVHPARRRSTGRTVSLVCAVSSFKQQRRVL